MNEGRFPGGEIFHFLFRVATDLENLESLEKSGNLLQSSKSQGKVREFATEFQTSGKSQGILFLKFIFSQVEDPNFENFLVKHAPRPP